MIYISLYYHLLRKQFCPEICSCKSSKTTKIIEMIKLDETSFIPFIEIMNFKSIQAAINS